MRGSQRTIVENNFIGTDATGTINLGNQGSGIADDSNAIDGVIRNNIIGFNQGSGIFLEGTGHLIESNQIYANHKGIAVGNSGLNNEILGNGIHNNTELGIDLSNNGVTPNDLGDGDAGANNSQNYPILTSVTANK